MPGLKYVVSICQPGGYDTYKFAFDYLNDATEFIKFCLRSTKVKLDVNLQVEYVKEEDK